MNILVTGCAGYLGSVLCQRLLNESHRVVGVDSLRYNNGFALLGLLSHPSFSFHCIDVRNRSSMEPLYESADVVIPLAALVGAPVCEENVREALETNHESITHLVHYLSSQQRILFPNTNSGYGKSDLATENSPLKPLSHYGVTKCLAESEVLQRANSVSLRLATVFGPSPRMRFDLMVNDWTARMVYLHQEVQSNPEAMRFAIYEPCFRRNFVHVQDVASAFLWCLKKSLCGVYNVGNPDANMTKIQLARTIASTVGLDRKYLVECPGADPDGRDYLVSNDKILKSGFTFQHGLRQGIWQIIKSVNILDPKSMAAMRNV